MHKLLTLALTFLALHLHASASPTPFGGERGEAPDYVPADVVWTTQSRNASESMPCGGHDIGLNVWVEQGDLLFYAAQSGWFDENNTLLKAGRWRLHFDGAPFDGQDFQQRLCLDDGAVYVSGGGVKVRLWADVFEPVVYVALTTQHTGRAVLSYESWRYRDRQVTKAECQQCSYKWLVKPDCTTFADSIVAKGSSLVFSHKNRAETVFDYTVGYEHLDAIKDSLYNPIGGLLMQGEMQAPGFRFTGTTDGVYASTDYRAWNFCHKRLRKATISIRLTNGLASSNALRASRGREAADETASARWWHAYWQRSYIQLQTQDKAARTMVRNYDLLRYMLGCNAYGQWPTKFNGGLFTFDPVFVDSTATFTPDYRKWGGGTMTAQNQRLVYWPMVKSGDYDVLLPQLDTYLRMLPNAIRRTQFYWGHGGASFTEQIENFGLPNPAEYGKHKAGDDLGVEKNKWLEYEWDTALEFGKMYRDMLPWHPDTTLEKYRPLVDEPLRFFAEHYTWEAQRRGLSRQDTGDTLVIFPGSGCETYKQARNPASTVAALKALGCDLPLMGAACSYLPDIPLCVIDGDTCIAPAESWERIQNVEVPQLYPVFPWRLYGVGRPALDIARNTYQKDPHAIAMRSTKGWKQDNIWAACLGLTDEARRLNTEKLADGPYRFTAFYDAGFDWAPDHNRGGAGMTGLQEMLLQEDAGHNPILFPAWPREWDCRFRLYLSGRRCVDATLSKGRVTYTIDGVDFSDDRLQSGDADPQWIGAITKADARLPEGRTYSGTELKNPEVKAAWAAADTLSSKSIYLRKAFDLEPDRRELLRQATVSICGLGFYELEINSRKVGDAVLAPLWSDYDKTLWYNTYDVTDMLAAGQNELRVLLGNGFYNEQGGRYHKMKIAFGPPTLLLRLHLDYSDGTSADVVSDGSWQYALSPVVFNSIYGGEDYDARITPQWRPAVVQEAPKGRLREQLAAPIRIMETYAVKQRLAHVYDMGQNLSGFPQITVRGQRGQTVRLTMGETLTDDGHVSQKQTGRPHYHTYTLKGDGEETWHPRFSYYGFRYIEVETEAELLDLRSCFIYNSAPKTGTFECSNPLLNDAYRIIDRAVRSNWQAVWTDCPHREKLGWLEQDWLNGEGLVYNYDCRTMIEQTMQNIADAQHADGAVPTTAPQYTIFPGETWGKPFNESPEWGGAFIALPLLYWHHYGDDSLIRRYYEPMKRYVDYLATQDSCLILDQGLGDWYDYADGKAGFARNTSVRFVSTAHFYRWTRSMAEMAALVGNHRDAQRYADRADSIKQAINATFYNRATHQYDTGSQCANAIALDLQLVPAGDREAVTANLVADIHAHHDRLTTGDVGNRYLFRVLAYSDNREHHELLYRMLNHYDTPGYGYQLRRGHTTLTEQWNPDFGSSMNHFMMGHLNNLLIPRLLGIDTDDCTTQLRIRPMPVGDLTWCRGSTACARGQVECQWEIKGRQFVLTCTLPAGMSALVTLPYSKKTVAMGDGLSTVYDSVPEP